MKTGIYHTENAGILFSSEQTGILIDGIHGGASVGFSPMPENEMEQIEEKEGIFDHLHGLLFTHLHIDHFKAKRVMAFLNQYPDTAIWGPGLEKRHLLEYRENGGDVRFRIGDFRFRAYQTDHSGEPYRNEPHLSVLVKNEQTGGNVLVSGDAQFYPELAGRIREENGRVDMVFVMIYQLIEKSSIQFLKELDPGRVLLYHRPDPAEDTNHLLSVIRSVLRHDPLSGKPIEVPEHRTWIDLT
ncbi:MAG: hypothetical protein HUJ73_07550 [Eubacterium sp.]|nr:hypothetical protein [Eubacterium sp.]